MSIYQMTESNGFKNYNQKKTHSRRYKSQSTDNFKDLLQNIQNKRLSICEPKNKQVWVKQIPNFQLKPPSRDLARLRKKIDQSTEMDVYDKNVELGKSESVKVFYSHYKKIDTILQQNDFTLTQQSPYTAILTNSISSNILPSKIGIIRDGIKDSLDIKKQKFGDQYLSALKQGLDLCPQIQNYHFYDNRISQKGADIILNNMNQKVEVIDLGENNIGKIGCDHLSKTLMSNQCRIMNLNLEGNKLGDINTELITKALLKNTSLRILNLSKNFLTDIISQSLKMLLQQNSVLKELYLHWNQIKSIGLTNIIESLIENDTLSVLDLSYNLGGKGKTDILNNYQL